MRLLLVLTLLCIGVYAQNTTIVKTPLGRIQGFADYSINGRKFYSFKGVPYALPPVGPLRFEVVDSRFCVIKEEYMVYTPTNLSEIRQVTIEIAKSAPQPIKLVGNLWVADTYYNCIRDDYFQHTDTSPTRVQGEEDCLYVNIYSPNVSASAKLDVLVFIHGGGFQFGTGADQGPHLLMDRDVVVVNVNYRLGILGFLCTEDSVIPGNNGLKDQVLALNWVHRYIKNFGGNPESVTIVGLSAGGASVHLHYMIPQSKGLFHRGFSQSGVANDPWVLMEAPLEKAKILGKSLGCNTTDSTKLKNCLKSKPTRQIVEHQKQFQFWKYNPFSPFGVVVDGAWTKNPVLPDHPLKLIRNKKILNVPWISSHVSAEGVFPCFDYYNDADISDLNARWNFILPNVLHYEYSIEKTRQDNVSQSIKKEYLKESDLSKSNFNKVIDMCSDRLFLVNIGQTNNEHAKASTAPVYTYQFNYVESTKPYSQFGASHGDDTHFIFTDQKDTNYLAKPIEPTKQLREIMLDMTIEFMKTGVPKMPVEWKPLSKKSSDGIYELQISGPNNITLINKSSLASYTYWNGLNFKENDNLFK